MRRARRLPVSVMGPRLTVSPVEAFPAAGLAACFAHSANAGRSQGVRASSGFRSALAHSAARKNELGAIEHRARTTKIAALPVTVVALARAADHTFSTPRQSPSY
jgi:hypothetical protein